MFYIELISCKQTLFTVLYKQEVKVIKYSYILSVQIRTLDCKFASRMFINGLYIFLGRVISKQEIYKHYRIALVLGDGLFSGCCSMFFLDFILILNSQLACSEYFVKITFYCQSLVYSFVLGGVVKFDRKSYISV